MNKIKRRDAIQLLLEERNDLLVVAGLGSCAYDIASCSDNALDFPTWGAMGGAAMMGLGIALAQPNRTVLVVTGDGEMLMGTSSLATIALQSPPNLRIVIMDNEQFGETGQQATHTAGATDLAAVAKGCGIENTKTLYTLEEVVSLREEIYTYAGTLFAVLKVSADPDPRVLPPRDGPFLTHRFRAGLLGEAGVLEA